jgi:hypothetical protein
MTLDKIHEAGYRVLSGFDQPVKPNHVRILKNVRNERIYVALSHDGEQWGEPTPTVFRQKKAVKK